MTPWASIFSSNLAALAITGLLTYAAFGAMSTFAGMMLTVPFATDALFGLKSMLFA
jgi:hypothetical protein